jgi:hypothetical protein
VIDQAQSRAAAVRAPGEPEQQRVGIDAHHSRAGQPVQQPNRE